MALFTKLVSVQFVSFRSGALSSQWQIERYWGDGGVVFKENGPHWSINGCTCHVLNRKPKGRGQSAHDSLVYVEFWNGGVYRGGEGVIWRPFCLPLWCVSVRHLLGKWSHTSLTFIVTSLLQTLTGSLGCWDWSLVCSDLLWLKYTEANGLFRLFWHIVYILPNLQAFLEAMCLHLFLTRSDTLPVNMC